MILNLKQAVFAIRTIREAGHAGIDKGGMSISDDNLHIEWDTRWISVIRAGKDASRELHNTPAAFAAAYDLLIVEIGFFSSPDDTTVFVVPVHITAASFSNLFYGRRIAAVKVVR